MGVFRFEGIDDTLDLLPLVARRALDAAGVKVSLADWRAMSLDARRALVDAGSSASVDAALVLRVLASAAAPTTDAPREVDPEADAVPPALADAVTLDAWRALSGVGRYALAKVARSKRAAELLPGACAEIAPLSTHVDARGQASMVDVAGKEVTMRRAIARARVAMQAATAARLRSGDVAKGDVLGTARIAGIQAAKRAPELIPLCHTIALTRVTVDFEMEGDGVSIRAVAEARDRTGVEMEALTAASVAALTVYDMLKSVDRGMTITVELAEKHGGKTGSWTR